MQEKQKQGIYEPKAVVIKEAKEMASGHYLFRIYEKMEQEPGQFVQIGLLGIGECPISICSYNKDYIELLIRNVGSITRNLVSVKKGETVFIRGPYGTGYPMNEMTGKNIVIIGGGCGVAPPRAVIEYIEKNRADYKDVFIYFGFRSPQDILFKEDVEQWKEKFTLKITLDKGDECWKGNVGLITALLENEKIPKDSAFVLCGPPIMMEKTIELLKKMGFEDDSFYVSFERRMKCGIKQCGHCMIHGKYVCTDGPVFKYTEVKGVKE